MNPVEAFQYLLKNNLPLILSFPLEEEKGHVITARGVCHIDKIHGTSRVTLHKFYPYGIMYHLRNCELFYATFEINGTTFYCTLDGFTFSGSIIVSNIPSSLKQSMRKFLRVVPSFKSPVSIHMNTAEYGTASFIVQDIAERGVSFISDLTLTFVDTFLCGLHLPVEEGIFILSKAAIVYRRESADTTALIPKALKTTIFYGLELFPHSEDEKKIRLYIMKRELEIKKRVQGEL